MLGGISTYLYNVYRRFDLRKIALIAPEHPEAETFDRRQLYSPARFPSRFSWLPGANGGWLVRQMYRKANACVQRTPGLLLHCGHVMGGIAARRVKQRHGTPYLVWTYAWEVRDNLLRSMITPALTEADLVLTISDYTRGFLLAAGVPESRIVIIRPGTDPAQFAPGMDTRDLKARLGISGKRVLLTVSRLTHNNRHKGHDVVFRALPQVLARVPDLIYLVAGDGDDRQHLEDLARACGVRDRVVFAGRVSDAELPLLYNACDVFIMCSREVHTWRGTLAEGFGIVYLEASACGRPVIGGRCGGIPDAVQQEETGLLVDPVDPNAVAAAIIRLFTTPGMAETMGRNGRKWVVEEMHWDRAAREFQQVIATRFCSREQSRPLDSNA
jgi:phosphatidylinositol alpha-1,6-mannosyltransferase